MSDTCCVRTEVDRIMSPNVFSSSLYPYPSHDFIIDEVYFFYPLALDLAI